VNETPVSQTLLDILCCPACEERPRVELRGDKLVCGRCGRAYAIREGIPIMLVEEAEMPGEAK
jgi:hypothetical protein